jgi:hypothetical protein
VTNKSIEGINPLRETDKNFLKKVLSPEYINAWLVQAEGFRLSANILIANNRLRFPASVKEINLHNSCYKIACYLLAHTIELLLKALRYKIPNICE